MASITRCGTCVPPGPSRKAAGCPLTVWESEGNWERTQVRSRAAGAKVSVLVMVFSLVLLTGRGRRRLADQVHDGLRINLEAHRFQIKGADILSVAKPFEAVRVALF